MGLDSIA